MKRVRLTRRSALVGALGALPTFAWSQAPATPATPVRRYAVLSLIGDEIGYVQRANETGTKLGPTERNATRVDTAVLDDIALTAAERALAEAHPSAERLRFGIRDKRLFALQERLLETTDGLRESMKGLLEQQQASHLLLVTKYRDDARFRLRTRWAGSGKLAGVGFYLDEYTRVVPEADSSEIAVGFYGTFAYVRATLVDAATMKQQAFAHATETDLATALGTSVGRAWDSVDMPSRSRTLALIIDKAVYTAARKVVSPS